MAVDCGVGVRTLQAALRAVGRRLADLDAVLLSHEHADHVRCLPQAVKAGVRVVCTAGTARAAGISLGAWEEIRPGVELRLPGMAVRALPVSHDAAEPCGYLIEAGGRRVSVMTDLGWPDPALAEPIASSDLIVLEANHDEALLRRGPYPAHLKRRVLSRVGHLSNAECGAMLAAALGSSHAQRARTVWLAHLSQTNNRPDMAKRAIKASLAAKGLAHEVVPLPRGAAGPIWLPDEQTTAPVQMPLPFG